MNANDLNHPYTPPALEEINKELAALLTPTSGLDLPAINHILAKRDVIVRAHIQSAEDDEKQKFAGAELLINDRLKELAQSLRQYAKDDVSQFLRSQAAVKKYK